MKEWRNIYPILAFVSFVLYKADSLGDEAIERTRIGLLPMPSLMIRDFLGMYYYISILFVILYVLSWWFKRLNSGDAIVMFSTGSFVLAAYLLFNAMVVLDML